MAKLTTKARKALPKKDFAEPSMKGYPIENKSHARDALARSSGKPEEAMVKKAVYAKYPEMKPKNKK